MHKRFRVFTRVKGRTYALISYILPHAKRFHKRPFGGLPQISVRFKPENDTRTNGRGVFDDGASLAHITLKDYRTMAGTELGRTFTLVHSGQTLTHAALKPNDYNLTRAADGSFTWTTTLMCANGSVPAWS